MITNEQIAKKLHSLAHSTVTEARNNQRYLVPIIVTNNEVFDSESIYGTNTKLTSYQVEMTRTDRYRYNGRWYYYHMSDTYPEETFSILKIDNVFTTTLLDRTNKESFIGTIESLTFQGMIRPFMLFFDDKFVPWERIEFVYDANDTWLLIRGLEYSDYELSKINDIKIIILPFKCEYIGNEPDYLFNLRYNALCEYLQSSVTFGDDNSFYIGSPTMNTEYVRNHMAFNIGGWAYTQIKLFNLGLLDDTKIKKLRNIQILRNQYNDRGIVINTASIKYNLLDSDVPTDTELYEYLYNASLSNYNNKPMIGFGESQQLDIDNPMYKVYIMDDNIMYRHLTLNETSIVDLSDIESLLFRENFLIFKDGIFDVKYEILSSVNNINLFFNEASNKLDVFVLYNKNSSKVIYNSDKFLKSYMNEQSRIYFETLIEAAKNQKKKLPNVDNSESDPLVDAHVQDSDTVYENIDAEIASRDETDFNPTSTGKTVLLNDLDNEPFNLKSSSLTGVEVDTGRLIRNIEVYPLDIEVAFTPKLTDYIIFISSNTSDQDMAIDVINRSIEPLDFEFTRDRTYEENIENALKTVIDYNPALLNDLYHTFVDQYTYTGKQANESLVYEFMYESRRGIKIPRKRYKDHETYFMLFVNGELFPYYSSTIAYANFFFVPVPEDYEFKETDIIEIVFYKYINNNEIRFYMDDWLSSQMSDNEEDPRLTNISVYEPFIKPKELKVFAHYPSDLMYQSIIKEPSEDIAFNVSYKDDEGHTCLRKSALRNLANEESIENALVAVSSHKFVYQRLHVLFESYRIVLDKRFRYCDNPKQYVLFINGRRMRQDSFLITIPKHTRPFYGMYLYTAKFVGPDDRIELFYLPYEMTDMNFDESQRHFVKKNGYFEFDRNLLDAPLSQSLYMLYINGKKVPASQIVDVNYNTIRLAIDMVTLGYPMLTKINIDSIDSVSDYMHGDSLSVYDELITFIKNTKGYAELDRYLGYYAQMSDIESNKLYMNVGKIAILNEIVRDFWVTSGYDYQKQPFIYDFDTDEFFEKREDGTLIIPAMDANVELNIAKNDISLLYFYTDPANLLIEYGRVLKSIKFYWQYTQRINQPWTIAYQKINDINIPIQARSYEYLLGPDSPTKFIFKANTGQQIIIKETELKYVNGLYWGCVNEISLRYYRRIGAIQYLSEIVAVIPKEGPIPSSIIQEIESGNLKYQAQIEDKNYIVGDLITVGVEENPIDIWIDPSIVNIYADEFLAICQDGRRIVNIGEMSYWEPHSYRRDDILYLVPDAYLEDGRCIVDLELAELREFDRKPELIELRDFDILNEGFLAICDDKLFNLLQLVTNFKYTHPDDTIYDIESYDEIIAIRQDDHRVIQDLSYADMYTMESLKKKEPPEIMYRDFYIHYDDFYAISDETSSNDVYIKDLDENDLTPLDESEWLIRDLETGEVFSFEFSGTDTDNGEQSDVFDRHTTRKIFTNLYDDPRFYRIINIPPNEVLIDQARAFTEDGMIIDLLYENVESKRPESSIIKDRDFDISNELLMAITDSPIENDEFIFTDLETGEVLSTGSLNGMDLGTGDMIGSDGIIGSIYINGPFYDERRYYHIYPSKDDIVFLDDVQTQLDAGLIIDLTYEPIKPAIQNDLVGCDFDIESDSLFATMDSLFDSEGVQMIDLETGEIIGTFNPTNGLGLDDDESVDDIQMADIGSEYKDDIYGPFYDERKYYHIYPTGNDHILLLDDARAKLDEGMIVDLTYEPFEPEVHNDLIGCDFDIESDSLFATMSGIIDSSDVQMIDLETGEVIGIFSNVNGSGLNGDEQVRDIQMADIGSEYKDDIYGPFYDERKYYHIYPNSDDIIFLDNVQIQLDAGLIVDLTYEPFKPKVENDLTNCDFDIESDSLFAAMDNLFDSEGVQMIDLETGEVIGTFNPTNGLDINDSERISNIQMAEIGAEYRNNIYGPFYDERKYYHIYPTGDDHILLLNDTQAQLDAGLIIDLTYEPIEPKVENDLTNCDFDIGSDTLFARVPGIDMESSSIELVDLESGESYGYLSDTSVYGSDLESGKEIHELDASDLFTFKGDISGAFYDECKYYRVYPNKEPEDVVLLDALQGTTEEAVIVDLTYEPIDPQSVCKNDLIGCDFDIESDTLYALKDEYLNQTVNSLIFVDLSNGQILDTTSEPVTAVDLDTGEEIPDVGVDIEVDTLQVYGGFELYPMKHLGQPQVEVLDLKDAYALGDEIYINDLMYEIYHSADSWYYIDLETGEKVYLDSFIGTDLESGESIDDIAVNYNVYNQEPLYVRNNGEVVLLNDTIAQTDDTSYISELDYVDEDALPEYINDFYAIIENMNSLSVLTAQDLDDESFTFALNGIYGVDLDTNETINGIDMFAFDGTDLTDSSSLTGEVDDLEAIVSDDNHIRNVLIDIDSGYFAINENGEYITNVLVLNPSDKPKSMYVNFDSNCLVAILHDDGSELNGLTYEVEEEIIRVDNLEGYDVQYGLSALLNNNEMVQDILILTETKESLIHDMSIINPESEDISAILHSDGTELSDLTYEILWDEYPIKDSLNSYDIQYGLVAVMDDGNVVDNLIMLQKTKEWLLKHIWLIDPTYEDVNAILHNDGTEWNQLDYEVLWDLYPIKDSLEGYDIQYGIIAVLDDGSVVDNLLWLTKNQTSKEYLLHHMSLVDPTYEDFYAILHDDGTEWSQLDYEVLWDLYPIVDSLESYDIQYGIIAVLDDGNIVDNLMWLQKTKEQLLHHIWLVDPTYEDFYAILHDNGTELNQLDYEVLWNLYPIKDSFNGYDIQHGLIAVTDEGNIIDNLIWLTKNQIDKKWLLHHMSLVDPTYEDFYAILHDDGTEWSQLDYEILWGELPIIDSLNGYDIKYGLIAIIGDVVIDKLLWLYKTKEWLLHHIWLVDPTYEDFYAILHDDETEWSQLDYEILWDEYRFEGMPSAIDMTYDGFLVLGKDDELIANLKDVWLLETTREEIMKKWEDRDIEHESYYAIKHDDGTELNDIFYEMYPKEPEEIRKNFYNFLDGGYMAIMINGEVLNDISVITAYDTYYPWNHRIFDLEADWLDVITHGEVNDVIEHHKLVAVSDWHQVRHIPSYDINNSDLIFLDDNKIKTEEAKDLTYSSNSWSQTRDIGFLDMIEHGGMLQAILDGSARVVNGITYEVNDLADNRHIVLIEWDGSIYAVTLDGKVINGFNYEDHGSSWANIHLIDIESEELMAVLENGEIIGGGFDWEFDKNQLFTRYYYDESQLPLLIHNLDKYLVREPNVRINSLEIGNNNIFVFACPKRLVTNSNNPIIQFIFPDLESEELLAHTLESSYLPIYTDGKIDPDTKRLTDIKIIQAEYMGECEFTNDYGFTETYVVYRTNGFFKRLFIDYGIDIHIIVGDYTYETVFINNIPQDDVDNNYPDDIVVIDPSEEEEYMRELGTRTVGPAMAANTLPKSFKPTTVQMLTRGPVSNPKRTIRHIQGMPTVDMGAKGLTDNQVKRLLDEDGIFIISSENTTGNNYQLKK